MDKQAKILVVGHNDIIENSLYDYFQKNGFQNAWSLSHLGINATIQPAVYQFFQDNRPEYVFLGSTRSGGIQANQESPAEFLYQNLEAQNNIIYASYKFEVRKLLYFAATCVYPRDCPQPIKEESLLTGELEKTSEAYSVAKIAGIKLCQAYQKQYGFPAGVMVPATVYGPENYVDMEKSHVMGALIAKFTDAVKSKKDKVVIWGSGNPKREFLHSDDLVSAALFLMERDSGEKIVNCGAGEDVAIRDLAQKISAAAGFKGKIEYDTTKPDGAPRKLLDSSRIKAMGWRPRVGLNEGIRRTIEHYLKKG